MVLALVVSSACAAGFTVGTTRHVSAAETHSNCVTFDPQTGNIISVTPNCTETDHTVAPPTQFQSPDPCDQSNVGLITIAPTHTVSHTTVNGAGDVWFTSTVNGTVTFASQTGGPNGQGTFTNWFGSSFNNRNAVFHSTFNNRIQLADGTTVTLHETFHMSFNANGVQLFFDKPTLTCG